MLEGRTRFGAAMIARVWTARATPAGSIAYRDHLERRVLPILRSLDGYQGASLLIRADGEEVEILVITRWRSPEAIRGFAGDDLERAVVADDAAVLLTEWDQLVRHYDVSLNDEPSL